MAVVNRQMKQNKYPPTVTLDTEQAGLLSPLDCVLAQTNKLYILMDTVHRYVSLMLLFSYFPVFW